MLTESAAKFVAALLLVLALILAPHAGQAQSQQAAADSVISNRAEAIYADDEGNEFSTVSPTVTVTVRPVAAIVVTPDETAPSATVAPQERITRLFRVCNFGNTPDLYTITRAEVTAPAALSALYFDTDASNTVTDADAPITLNSTMSPRLAPRACVGVLAVVDVNASAPQTQLVIRLDARSNVSVTVNGTVEDTGTIINAVGERARLTDPQNPALPPSKLVNSEERVTTAPGQTLDYAISFRNNGATTARRVLVADDLPAGLQYVPGSLRLGSRALTDAADADEGQATTLRLFEVRVAEVQPGEVVTINFRAQVTGEIAPGAGAVNTATLSGENFDSTNSSAATAVVNPFGTVYAGRSGGAVTVAGARVALVTDPATRTPLPTAPGVGFTPNVANDNPYTTAQGGLFSFALTPAQLAAPATYYVNVTAPGYRSRMLEFSVRPASVPGLYDATVRALDEQPIAESGSFTLTESDVRLANLASVALNIPLFELQTLEINKIADQQRAEIGDIVSYRVEVRNTTQAPLHDVTVRDLLPQSFHYAPNTAQLTIAPAPPRAVEPQVNGNELTFNLGTLAAGARASLVYRTRIGVNAREGDQTNSATASGLYASGERVSTSASRATVRVGRGVFSTRQIIIGRVFEDKNGNDEFDAGERPVEGARLYIDNGQSVITDSEGMYSLPSVEDGAVVIALDPITLPRGYALTDEGRRSGRSWARLLRTPLGGGTLLRQNFALRSKDGANVSDDEAATSVEQKDGKPKPLRAPQLDAINPAPAPTTNATNARTTNAPTTNSLAPTTQAIPNANSNATAAPQPAPEARIEKISDEKFDPKETAKPSGNLSAGTYELESSEVIAPVAPGDVLVVSPSAGEVVMSAAMQVEVRVAEDWTAALEVNGQHVGEKNIGLTRVDHKNKVTTFTFVGLSVRPGQNRVRAFAVSPEGKAGRAVELNVAGRGPARRLEITPERDELQAGGRDSAVIRVRAFDQWNNPAADGQVAVATSLGHFLRPDGTDAATAKDARHTTRDKSLELTEEIAAENLNATLREVVLSLRGGEATVRLVSDNTAGVAQLQAQAGDITTERRLRFTAELRPTILVGLAEASVGRAAPENTLRGDDSRVRSHIEFFYRGSVFGKNLLTLAYDSQRSLNRTQGHDRLFQADPLERAYPIFGDSSTRFSDVESNSKLYARVDRDRSYAMFGDFEAGLTETQLAGYSRKLTGVKVHLENSNGDFIAVTGARPDTSFARDVFPAGRIGLINLSYPDVLPGSETVALEVRDRRNPEVIISREPLLRSLDYNLDPLTGQLFFMRPISAFDYDLNLVQLVVTYEHRAAGMSSGVYTGRASKRFNRLGLRMGLSFIEQKQSEFGSYVLGGIDGEQALPNRGALKFEWAMSRGDMATGGNIFNATERHAGGNAYRLELTQPLKVYEAMLHAEYARADEGFFNPFGATVAPGSQRTGATLDLKPGASRVVRLGFLNERNRTANVDNSRNTFSLLWTETFSDRLHAFFGYDYRRLTDSLNDQQISSNLVTVGAQYRPTDKLELSVKREQNLGESDPTFPSQTTIAARYKWNDWANIFFTQRLASAPIIPISDTTATGFASTGSRRETSIGVETKLGRYTNMVSRYQLENGINGTDSFAVLGLQNRLPISKQLSLDLGFEHGFHLAGDGQSFTGGSFGFSYLPSKDLRTAARYELRNQTGGLAQLITVGAAGRIGDGVTTLARFQSASSNYQGRENSSLQGTIALALRPLKSDRTALLLSYTHRSLTQSGLSGQSATTDRSDTLSTDGLWQPFKDTELYGRVAVKFGANSREGLMNASALTYLAQLRAQKRLRRAFDVAGEVRLMAQPSTHTTRTSVGAEIGYWVFADMRVGVGYNFTDATEPGGLVVTQPRGFYFTISTKLSNLFDLFGTAADGLAVGNDGGSDATTPAAQPKKEGAQQ
ncbi:MAG: large repetitive protein [Pyrinomonadaceae bacterium]|nr:large repetitive protein [Pyrinomonadaceae bacterium]